MREKDSLTVPVIDGFISDDFDDESNQSYYKRLFHPDKIT